MSFCSPLLCRVVSVGVFVSLMTACGGGGGGENAAPKARAGADQTVEEGTTVTLDGSASTDSDGSIASYQWSQVPNGSPTVNIASSTSARATFQTPQVTEITTLQFQLRVVDDDGAQGLDRVNVTVTDTDGTARVLGIGIIGLGESVFVTNTATVTISGMADSDANIQKVTYGNLTNSTSGDATGTKDWSASVMLAEGDNRLRFSLVTDGGTGSVETTITYFPALDFTTNLEFNKEFIYQGDQPSEVLVNIGTNNADNPQLSLRGAKSGAESPALATLKDDGVLPDEIQGDGIYSGRFNFGETTNGEYCYRVHVTDTQSNAYHSEQECVWLVDRYTNEELDTVVSLADQAAMTYQAQVEQGATPPQAAAAVLAQLQQNARIGTAGSSDDGGIWWVSTDGILGLYHPTFEGQKGANGSRQAQRASASNVNPSENGEPAFGPASYHADRALSPASNQDSSRVQSTKAMILSPYLHHFGSGDDYHGAWQVIKGSQSCALQDEKEAVDGAVTLDDFKGWSTFGYIHISTHGNSFYRGLLSLWQDEWGSVVPSQDHSWATGFLAQVAVGTGIQLPGSSGNWNTQGFEDDLHAKRMAIAPGGTIVLLPGFFAAYLDPLPNSIVVMSSCRSGYNNSLFHVLLAKGAGAVVGYDGYVQVPYAHNTTKEIIRAMLNDGRTFGEAVNDARSMFGAADGSGTRLVTAGNNDLRLSEGDLTNGDFESGDLTPWVRAGDGRIIRQLGATNPTGGSFMGIISTGLGFTTQTGQIAQSVCLSDSATKLKFRWNFFSEEFLEFCDSQFDDAFRVDLCEDGDDSACSTPFSTRVNQLCTNPAALSQSDVSFDQGDVSDTGWQSQEIDVTGLAGSNVDLRFFSTDVGDSIYDTAILLDDIVIE